MSQPSVDGIARSAHPLYATWIGMINRCENRSCAAYKYYGGRGIEVCARWRRSFDSFVLDMGMRPSAAHSIDRINVNGHYEPINCRWATDAEQAGNRRPVYRGLPEIERSYIALTALRERLDAGRVNRAAFADAMGLSTSAVYAWLIGRSRPEAHYRGAIERLYGIPADDWMTDEEFVICHGRRRDAA